MPLHGIYTAVRIDENNLIPRSLSGQFSVSAKTPRIIAISDAA